MTVHTEAIREHFMAGLGNASDQTKRVRLMWCNKFLAFTEKHAETLEGWDETLVMKYRKHVEAERKDGAPRYKSGTVRLMLSVTNKVFVAANKVYEDQRRELMGAVDLSRVIEEQKAIIEGIKPDDPQAQFKLSQAQASMQLAGLEEQSNRQKAMLLPGPVWNVGRGYLPEVHGEAHPGIGLGDLRRMIDAAHMKLLAPAEAAFLAIASVYGPRSSEITAIYPDDINYEGGAIYLGTKKHGERRTQPIPSEIVPYLNLYTFGLEYSPFLMWKMFGDICRKSGVEKINRMGWHSMRRTVDTELTDALNKASVTEPDFKGDPGKLVHIWLRWKRSSMPMQERYYAPEEADKVILAHHPILPLWRKP